MKKSLRIIRIVLAALCFISITLLFVDFTGTIQPYLGWLAKIQFLPALLALNVGVVVVLLIITLLFGRIYCSVICPLGVFQDIVAWLSKRGKKARRYRYHYRKPQTWVRYVVLGVFVVLMVAGVNSVALLIAPYSMWGRMVQACFPPFSWPVLIVAIISFVGLFIWAWFCGRAYCNTVCPVGTTLSFLSRFSLFRPVINTDKCNGCGLCARACKASCINAKEHKIDLSRCVTCFDCVNTCRHGAIAYKWAFKKREHSENSKTSENSLQNPEIISRRQMLTGLAAVAGTVAVQAKRQKIDRGLAYVSGQKVPERKIPLVPAGSISPKHLYQHCVACQLCVAACPNKVLHASGNLTHFLQPEMSFERGFCPPDCVKCSEVCPAGSHITGAITKITVAEKTHIQIGRAVVILENCRYCGRCARCCPMGAITMVSGVPTVDENRCIGCGKCEYVCPTQPFKAIYVEGLEEHIIH